MPTGPKSPMIATTSEIVCPLAHAWRAGDAASCVLFTTFWPASANPTSQLCPFWRTLTTLGTAPMAGIADPALPRQPVKSSSSELDEDQASLPDFGAV